MADGDWLKIGNTELRFFMEPKMASVPVPAPAIHFATLVPGPTSAPDPAAPPAISPDPVYSPSIVWSGRPPELHGTVDFVEGPHLEGRDFSAVRFALGVVSEISMMLSRRPVVLGNRDDKVSVRVVRVTDASKKIRAARIKGEIVSGAVHVGDVVSFWGDWRYGTLNVAHGFNHDLDSDIAVAR